MMPGYVGSSKAIALALARIVAPDAGSNTRVPGVVDEDTAGATQERALPADLVAVRREDAVLLGGSAVRCRGAHGRDPACGARGSAIDPSLVALLLRKQRERGPLDELTDRERGVPGLVAAGRSNQAIANRLVVTLKTVETHVANIFSKLALEPEPDGHRRVLAVHTYLRSG
jgi:DNA-binding CsgD family transcriptional regulator